MPNGMHDYWAVHNSKTIKYVPWVPRSYDGGILGNGKPTFIIGESHYDDPDAYATTYWIMKYLSGYMVATYSSTEQAITGLPTKRDFSFWTTIAYHNFIQEALQKNVGRTRQQITDGLLAFRTVLDCPRPPRLMLIFSSFVWNEVSHIGVAGPVPSIKISGRGEMSIFTASSGAQIYAGRLDHPTRWKYQGTRYSDWHPLIAEYIALAP
jgi:hypothetical protein